MERVNTRALFVAFMGLAALAPAGCGTEGFVMAPVSGKVTVDGQPVAGLRVSVEPVGGASRPVPGPEAMGVTDAEGRYSVATTDKGWRGAVVGPCRVRIWSNATSGPAEVITDDRDPNYDPVAEIKALKSQMRAGRKKAAKVVSGLIPQRFNDETTLTLNVPPGGTDKADFAITSK